ncbi:uncharacterized protein A1O9_00575 [Exophiala aquamarina CBS 119918]|uniref:Kelch repeat-containing protein n=1 Tax=Exophiala aquamarina CBS 119918 TaxID=1182545 RepID=A0A072PS56_9EURO|nr:uncharacterized protein A1O9_00575 [Exophiala aquamarina CBS 119918]KEF62602.1 hypothetical protein A1O9_00575 [Exophiala aquamarina CBS 119918]
MQSSTTSSTARPYSPAHASTRRNFVTDQQISRDDTSACDEELPHRSSAFLEIGLGGDDPIVDAKLRREARPKPSVRFRSKVDIVEPETFDDYNTTHSAHPPPRREMPFFSPTLPRLLFLVLVIVLIAPSLHTSLLLQVDANPVRPRPGPLDDNLRRSNALRPMPHTKRADTSTTIYSDFLTLDLTKSWQISSPSLTGLPIPSGPPSVSLGYLWNSYDSLYLYGGEFSDNPVTSPVPFSTWSYDIGSSSWSESKDPRTVAGENSDGGNNPVQRAAEGAGLSIPNLGRGFYFGGHLDGYTTEGWSQSIARVYLRGLLEYTFPGYSNPAVNNGAVAGAEGVYRNITEGGIQDSSGFPERADGILVYVPGYGKSGIILGLAGGTNATFTQMNVIDVYDIDSSTWYKQATTGPTPEIRVNPCAVAVSAADGSSTQVYMYGGQNLIPAGEQKQYDDVWILTVPSFTWIRIDTSDQSVPPARAGHTCNVWNGQMVVVGGYVGQDLSCDSPGIYVFNTSSLAWQNSYVALETDDSLNRQTSQKHDPSALQGSFGYAVPKEVQSVIGGNAVGAATITAPAQTASNGPLATGGPITYTVTGADGSVATETSIPGSGTSESGHSSSDKNVGAIVAGVIAGCLGVLAAYLGFCAWIYRRQLKIYKNHTALAQNQTISGGDHRYFGTGFIGGGKLSNQEKSQTSDSRNSADNRSGDANSTGRANALSSNNPYRSVPGGAGTATAASSTEDLMAGQEPSFLGVMLNPRRSLRVVNRD